MSKVIRGEELGDCAAWLVPQVSQDGAQKARPLTARDLENIQKRAREEGFRQGREEGKAAGLGELQAQIRTLQTLLQSLDKPLEQLDETIERQLTELAMLVARQLVRRELKTEPEQVVAVVREALSALPVATRNVRLALHPEDAALIRQTLIPAEGDAPLEVVDDPVQSRGGCRVVTDTSQIDASVEARLNAIINHVLGGQRSSDGEPE